MPKEIKQLGPDLYRIEFNYLRTWHVTKKLASMLLAIQSQGKTISAVWQFSSLIRYIWLVATVDRIQIIDA